MEMKTNRLNRILLGFTLILCVSLFGACRKTPINGDLDGHWQIMSVEWVSDGSDVSPLLRSYICINLHIMQLRNVSLSEDPGSVFSGNMYYDKAESKITVDFPYNTSPNQVDQLHPWGIYTNPVTFDIVKLDGKQLVLRTPETFITCRRY